MAPVRLAGTCGQEAAIQAAIPIEVLREEGVWQCVEVPGFLVFSKLEAKYLTAFTDELRASVAALADLRAPTDLFRPRTTQVPVILRPQYGIVPGRPEQDMLQAFEDDLALIYLAYIPGVIQGASGPNPVLTSGPILRLPGSGAVGPGAWGGFPLPDPVSAQMLACDHLIRELRRRTPAPPAWLVQGFQAMLADLRFSGRQATVMADIPVSVAPLAEVLTDEFPDPDDPAFAGAAMQARAFLQWGLSGDESRRTAFWRFARLAAVTPMHEGLFREAFGLGFAQMDLALDDVTLGNDGYIPALFLDNSGTLDSRPAIDVREPYREEIDGLVRTVERMQREPPVHASVAR